MIFYNVNRVHFDLTSPADGRVGIGNDNAAASAGGVTEQKVRILSGITIISDFSTWNFTENLSNL